MLKYLFFSSILILFTACANPNDIDYNSVKNDQNITTIEKLIESNITKEERTTISLGKDYCEMILDNKKKVFASKFNISNTTEPCSINIKSSTFKGFFAPKLLFLDKDYKILKTVTVKELRFDRGYFKGTIFLNEEIKKFHYLIVTQDLNEINKKYKTTHVKSSVITNGYFYYAYASGDIKSTLSNADGGNVELLIEEYKVKILGEEEKDSN